MNDVHDFSGSPAFPPRHDYLFWRARRTGGDRLAARAL